MLQNNAPFFIGDINIDPPLALAPMAGISHSPFRQLVAGFGKPGLFFSEMLSARHLPHDVKKNSLWLQRDNIERPMAYQIVASSAEEAAIGAKHLFNYQAEIIDLNLSCPAPNISRRKAGAHLLSDLATVEAMLKTLRQTVPCPVSVKIRLGTKPDLVFLKDLAQLIEQCGMDAITLHPRIISEKLKRKARWEYIGHLKGMTTLPVFGNGDVKTAADCRKMFAQTGCDGVMIGRAAVQKPWIFAEICGAEFELTADFLYATYNKAFAMICDFFPPERAKGRIKEFTWHFSKNLTFGHRFAARLQSKETIEECQQFSKENFLRAV